MTAITRDPLLAIARGLLLAIMAMMILAGATCLLMAVALLVFDPAVILAHVSASHPRVGTNDMLGASLLVLALATVLVALVWKVLQLLKRIVDTVGAGDPFVPVNADRLTRMAWLTLAIQGLSLPLVGLGMWLAEAVSAPGTDIDASGGISGNGLLLVLVLFILARVFRQGAAMRAELEGTV